MIKVKKADGSVEPYNEDKIRLSANRIGVTGELQDLLVEDIRGSLYDGITTSEIFTQIKSYLGKKGHAHLATKYNLKSALAELGPSGYPFEKYLSALLEARGYTCQTNQILEGSAVSHEIDVLANKNNVTYFVEAKFHKNPTQRTDVRVTLYIYARYLDLVKEPRASAKPWIITNTRFSLDALTYGKHQHILLTSWNYPRGDSLADWIEMTHLHPITMLDGLTAEDKRRLLTSGIVTCQALIASPLVKSLIESDRLEQVLLLARRVCENS